MRYREPMVRFGTLALVLAVGCGSRSGPVPLVLGEPPTEEPEPAVIQHLGAGDVEMDPVLGTLRALTGAGVPFVAGDVPAFIAEHASALGTTELVDAGTVVEPELTSIQLAQRYHGLPVVGGHLGLTISHGRLVLVQGATHRIGELSTAPGLTEADAITRVLAAIEAPQPGDRDGARLVVLPERAPGTVTYTLAWEVTAWRSERQIVVNVDARTGRLIGGFDANHYDHTGIATNFVDERTVGDPVVALPAGYLRLHARRASTTTEPDGTYRLRGASGPVMVTANLQGDYVRVHNVGGPEAQFVGISRPDKQNPLEWTSSRGTPQERDVFYGVNRTNRFVATVFPGNAWINQPLLANVDLPRTCNAFWNGSSVNFFVAGNGCNNSGRIFDVIAHEWGHGLDQNLPGDGIDGGLGEFIGDMISFLQTNSHLIGPGFLTDGRPVRDLEDPAFACYDPKKKGVHAKGQLLGAVVWDILTDLEQSGMTGEPLKRLMLRPIAIAQTRAQWYRAMLAVDDDDGNLANGTPHECLIYNQFKAHSCGGTRWPGIPDEDPPHCRN